VLAAIELSWHISICSNGASCDLEILAKHGGQVREGAVPSRPLSLEDALDDERAALDGRPLPSLEAIPTRASGFKYALRLFGEVLGLSNGIWAGVRRAFRPQHSPRRDGSKAQSELFRGLNSDDRWALCLSGGGIRSAAFALGILQCFAASTGKARSRGVNGEVQALEGSEPLLMQFDYLSTVSGGGYIGSWLSAWLLRESDGAHVVNCLGRLDARSTTVEPIASLRTNTNYLAPRTGVMSPDAWAAIAVIVRNLLLNWLVIIPGFCLAILLTKWFAWFWYCVTAGEALTSAATIAIGGAGLAALLFSLSFTNANRPTRGLANFGQSAFCLFDLAPFLLGAIALAIALTSSFAEAWLGGWLRDDQSAFHGTFAAGGAALYLLSWLAARLWSGYGPPAEEPKFERKPIWRVLDASAWTLAGVAFGLVIALGTRLVLEWPIVSENNYVQLARFLVPVPWVIFSRLVADLTFVGLANAVPRSDGDREWLARAAGLYSTAFVAWLAVTGLVLLGSQFVFAQISSWWKITGGATGILSTILGIVLGTSYTTGAIERIGQAARSRFSLDTLATIAAYVFIAALWVALSSLLDWLIFGVTFAKSPLFVGSAVFNQLQPAGMARFPQNPATIMSIAAAALFVPWLLLCFLVNVNRFSLHALYRNRLVHTFLGASNLGNDRDTESQFTHFDESDNPRMWRLWADLQPALEDFPAKKARLEPKAPAGPKWRPFHVINITVNLARPGNLAWQQRKAASFTVSPLHAGCGGDALTSGGAFRLSREYGGREGGISLGTAFAISGAAVSPNMGYHTSPGVALLMTLFNVRLGWWLGNPAIDNDLGVRGSGPAWAPCPLMREALGLTNEHSPYIYLSDGGHFENLGLYEMIRRRCRLIVVSDAGEDLNFKFEDLGNAIRKIWIDLGVEICFDGLEGLVKRPDPLLPSDVPPRYWAVADVRYRKADGDGEDGRILYIKSGIYGSEPIDVLSYALDHPTYPHESTSDQFFSESQFESYRALGFEIASQAIAQGAGLQKSDCVDRSKAPLNVTLREIIDNLKKAIVAENLHRTGQ
jgi:hypothetical protein